MSISRHLDVLAAYDANAVRVVPHTGEAEAMLEEGGGLQAAFARLGRAPMLVVLRDPQVQSVTVVDGHLEVEATRVNNQARVCVRWEGTVLTDDQVDIPPADPIQHGPAFRPDPASKVELSEAVSRHELPLFAVEDELGNTAWYTEGLHGRGVGARPLLGRVNAVDPGELGARSFGEAHGTRMAYVAGAMAGGIASADMVIAMCNAGLIAFFGAGGLPVPAVEQGLQRMAEELKGRHNWGANLLNNPNEPAVEEATVDLYLRYGVRRVSASAYMTLSPAVVRYRLTGATRDAAGRPVLQNHVFAKVSRPEVASHFLRPAPGKLLDALVADGKLTAEEAAIGLQVPVACDITAEADSGGHTDHRPLMVLLPILQDLRDQIAAELGYADRGVVVRVGAAGGLGTPRALWGAFAMGADYVLTGSVNQATLEAGTSDITKQLLLDAAYTDVATGPAPDMFELGAKVQVLSRGSMYARRAQQLYEIYKTAPSLEQIPTKQLQKIEKQLFRRPLSEVWQGTREYWQGRDPRQVERAEANPKFKMALTFRWYLGMTSRWARIGEADRKRDYQVWCGPAMGGFNAWVKGTPLQPIEARSVVAVAQALMTGAAVEARRARVRTLVDVI